MEPIPAEHTVPDAAARQRLAKAAVSLFTQKGYAATTVREIVEAAGVTKPALYYHFKSKEGIYLETLGEAMQEFESLVEAFAPGDEPADVQLRRFVSAVHDLTLKRLDLLRLVHSILYGPPQGAPFIDFHAVHDRMIESIRSLVRFGVERREFSAGDENGMTLAVLGAFNIVCEMQLVHPEKGLGREDLDSALSVVFRGMKAAGHEQGRS